jgi:uncharacterized protein YijF (DUF1287 family)
LPSGGSRHAGGGAAATIDAVVNQVALIGRQTEVTLIAHPRTVADRVVNGAKLEVVDGVRYDAAYAAIPYPNGDVPADRGACTDVIVRALRRAGYDLQQLVHEDMGRDFEAYPKLWGLTQPDSNIDHRRRRTTWPSCGGRGDAPALTTGDAAPPAAGDLVYWKLSLATTAECLQRPRPDDLPRSSTTSAPATSQMTASIAGRSLGISVTRERCACGCRARGKRRTMNADIRE